MKKTVLMMVMILLSAFSAIAQITQMKGVVISDDDGEPVIGATVTVTGTQNIAITNVDGEFSLKGLTPDNKTITVTYVGMAPQTVAVAPEVKVVMRSIDANLDEVIVVAFGKQKRESFTGSASVVTAATIERQQVNNPIEALNGNVTGFQMTETNSFTSDPEITIRGIGSLNASTAPLIVLDGLPYNGYWNDINPSDVASITVLKDAASNALYGARGANGVILITTKGAERGNTKVNFEAKWGVNSDGRIKYDYIKDPGQYYEAHYMAMRNYYVNEKGMNSQAAHMGANNILGQSSANGGLGYMVYSVPEGQTLIGTNGRLNPQATLGNRIAYNGGIYTLYPDDWTDAGLRHGFRQEYNLTLTGGNDRFSILAALGYLSDEGISYGSDIERLSARLKTEYKAYDFLRIGANAGYTHTETNLGGGVFSTLTAVGPIYPLFVRDGEGNILHDTHGRVYDYGNGNNGGLMRPVDNNNNLIQNDLLDKSDNISNAFNIQGYGTFDFLNNFHLTVNGSVYITENRMNTAYNPYYGYSQTTGGSTYIGHYRTTDSNFQQLLNYNNSFGDHNVDVLIGHEYSRTAYTELEASRSKIAMFDTNTELDGAVVDASMGSYTSNYNVEGYFIRGQYDYANRYFGSFSFRRDGSSNFHPKHRWGNFWSLGAAWIITREEWFPKNQYVNMLKVKASYGEQGNDGIGQFRYVDTYSIKNSDGEVAYVFSTKGNENITWETVGSFNAGVEFELFNSRLNGGVDFYVRNTRDMLMWLSTPYSIGYSGYYDNIGDMRNTGVEVQLSGDIIATRDFSWNVGVNLTWERNRITYLPEDKKEYELDGVRGYPGDVLYYGEGLPVSTWMLKKSAGVDENGQALWWTNINGTPEKTTRYEDAEYHLCGSALPDVFGGFNTSIRFRDFDLNAQFNYSIGGKKFDSTYQAMMSPPTGSLTGYQLHKDVFNAWSPTNASSSIPRWQYDDIYAASTSDRWLTDASYLSFRNLSIGYTLPKSITERIKMSRLRVYVSADNIYYWTKRQGFDPRMDALYGNYNSSSGYSFPMRTISGGLSIQL